MNEEKSKVQPMLVAMQEPEYTAARQRIIADVKEHGLVEAIRRLELRKMAEQSVNRKTP